MDRGNWSLLGLMKMKKQIAPLDRTHIIVFMFAILIGETIYMVMSDFGIAEWMFPIWLAILIIIEAIILLKDMTR